MPENIRHVQPVDGCALAHRAFTDALMEIELATALAMGLFDQRDWMGCLHQLRIVKKARKTAVQAFDLVDLLENEAHYRAEGDKPNAEQE